MIQKTIAAAVITLAAFTQVGASDVAKYPALDIALEQNGGKLVKTFDVGNSLKGHVVQFGRRSQIAYTTNDGKYAMLGQVFDASGAKVTEQHYAELPPPEYTDLWPKAAKAATVTTGKGKNDIYVFFEPFCGYCMKLYDQMKDQNVKVHWIIVDFLNGTDSTVVSAKILGSKDRAKALHNWVEARKSKKESDYMGGTATVDSKVEKALADNRALMEDAGVSGTPALLYRNKANQVMLQPGLPDEFLLTQIRG